jgi:microcystin-dependent protein
MSEPYIGQVEFFAFGFAPKGWALCAGQTMSINQNQALFSLLGTTYGGNGSTNFMLPDLRGRLAVSQGNTWVLGQTAGEANHTLLLTETPSHTHGLAAASGTSASNTVAVPGSTLALAQATGDVKGTQSPASIYATDNAPNQAMASQAIGTTGGQAHSNTMPYLALNPCIALTGLFPSRG